MGYKKDFLEIKNIFGKKVEMKVNFQKKRQRLGQ